MDVNELHLDRVRALLAQAGRSLSEFEGLNGAAFVQAVLDAMCDLSSRDALTGVLNRRSFQIQLVQELDRVARSGESALLLIVDIDHFKQVNDTYGHLAGDAVIRAVARALTACVRPMDTVARFGGEEFGVILPNCPSSFAHTVGERIRANIQDMVIELEGYSPIRVTVSCGGAFAPGKTRTMSDDWLARADALMYQAKMAGRNTVCIEMQPDSAVSAEEKGLLFGLAPDDTSMINASEQV